MSKTLGLPYCARIGWRIETVWTSAATLDRYVSRQSCDMMYTSCDMQVTIQLAKEKHPRKVLGIDIDQKLIKTAWKNLHRYYVHGIPLGLQVLAL